MLEKPDLQDEAITACLEDAYGLRILRVAFLPIGADQNTAVYRAVAADGTPYFVKLRRGAWDKIAVTLPRFLHEQGIETIIPPVPARNGQLWADLEPYRLILYPYVDGRDGYEVNLSDRQWVELGAALKRIHTAHVPPAITGRIRRETFSPQWREIVKTSLKRVDDDTFADPVAAKVAAFLKGRREEVLDLVGRAERLARVLQTRTLEWVVCHSDIHAGNVLVGAGGALYLVDWDEPILAPRERDLMYAGGDQMGGWRTPEDEETLFYRGYGPAQVDPFSLAYYRYERIVQDIAVYCEQLLLTDEGGQDREQSLRYLMSNFEPNGVMEITYRSDRTRLFGTG